MCLYGSNRDADVAAVAAGLHAVRSDVVVALDEEGGDVTRLEAATARRSRATPRLGAVDDVDLTRGVGRALGAVLRASGIDLDLAPCADVNSDPDNPVIGVRSFGADPALVARHVAAFVVGAAGGGRGGVRQALPRARRDARRLAPGAADGRCAGATCCASASWCRSGPPSPRVSGR